MLKNPAARLRGHYLQAFAIPACRQASMADMVIHNNEVEYLQPFILHQKFHTANNKIFMLIRLQ